MSGGDLGMLAQYGILGLLVLALLFGKVVPGYIAEQKDRQIARLETKLEEYELYMRDKVLPALIASNDVLSKVARQINGRESR